MFKHNLLCKCAIALSALLLLAFQDGLLAQEGGVEVFSAETIFDGGTRVSSSYIYKRKASLFRGSSEVADSQNRVSEEHRFVAGIDHGFRPDLTASLLVPYVLRSQETGGVESIGDGPGDIAVSMKYRAWKMDWPKTAAHLAFLAGVEMPTGNTAESENGVRLAPGLQPGSGSWDPFVAVMANISPDLWRFDWLLFYKANTEGSQNFEEGDFISMEIDGKFRFWHKPYPGASHGVKLGLQWRHQERSKQSGASTGSSGSDELVLRTGITLHPVPRLDISASADIPLYQDFNGEQLAQDIRVFFALGVRF